MRAHGLPCSCGRSELHVVARRETADGAAVEIWSDGDLTWRAGFGMRGFGTARTDDQRQAFMLAAWAVAGVVELLANGEVPRAVQAARKAVQRGVTADAAIRAAALQAVAS